VAEGDYLLLRSEEDERVMAWRTEYALALGYSEQEACLIAVLIRLELHELDDLIHAGCPKELALRIAIPC